MVITLEEEVHQKVSHVQGQLCLTSFITGINGEKNPVGLQLEKAKSSRDVGTEVNTKYD